MYGLLCVGRCFGDGFDGGRLFRHMVWLVLCMVALSQTDHPARCPQRFVPWYVGSSWSRLEYWLRRGDWLWFLLGSLGRAFRCVLAGATVREFYRFGFALCNRFPFSFVLLEVPCRFDLCYVEFLQELQYFLGVVVGKSLKVFHKVLSDRCDTFFVEFVEAITFLLPVFLISPESMQLCGLLCPFGPYPRSMASFSCHTNLSRCEWSKVRMRLVPISVFAFNSSSVVFT